MTTSSITNLLLIVLLASLGAPAEAQSAPRFKAVAFDYFVIFNAGSIIPAVEDEFPGKGSEFTKAWQAKQFDYCFLSSITGQHEDFFKLTDDALVYTAQAMKLDLTPDKRERLLNAYLKLKPWPDTVAALRRLKASGVRVIALSNLSEKMLRANADNAGITDLFDQFVSTDVNGTFKPDPRAYALGMKVLNLKKEDILFAAFGGWDAYGAKSFGYTTYWVNRFHLPQEQIGRKPDATSSDFEGLLDFVLGHS
jgi:2-haloacid dehalogenase